MVIFGVGFPNPKAPLEIFGHVGFIDLFVAAQDDRNLVT